MTRTFLAVELSEGAREAVERRVARLRRALPGVRWAEAESVHLTLVFLGELDDARLEAVVGATREVAGESRGFRLRLDGLGVFGPRWAPRVIWLGLAGDVEALVGLRERLAGALEGLGFPREGRPFAPHVTLARLKQPLAPDALARLEEALRATAGSDERAEWHVGHVAVMKSELSRTGARYTRLHGVALGATDGEASAGAGADEGE